MAGVSHIRKLYVEAYSNHPKEVWSMAVLTFINRMGTMVLPFLTVYLTTILDYSLYDAGLIMSSFGLGMFAGSYLGGKATNVMDSNLVIVISLICSGITFICLQFVFDFWPLAILIFIGALLGESYRPAMMVSLGKVVSKDKMGRTMSLIRLAINLGMSAGPLLGGYIAVKISYAGLFWIDGVTCIVAAIFFFYHMRTWRYEEVQITEDPEKTIKRIKPFRDKRFMKFLLATVIMGWVFMQWFHTVPVLIKKEWGYDERYIGLLMAVSCLIVAGLEMPIIHSAEERNKVFQTTVIGLGLIGVSYLCFLLPPALWVCFLAVVIWTFGEIFHLPLNTSTAVNLSPEKGRGDYMAWYFMCWAFANIFGPIGGLGFAEKFGFDAFWILLFISIIISIWITLSLKPDIQRPD